MSFVVHNGKVLSREQVQLGPEVWESLHPIVNKCWYGHGSIPLFMECIEIINRQLEILQIPRPPVLNNSRELFRITKRMLNKNKYYRSGLVNIQLYPIQGDLEFIIHATASREFDFPINEKDNILVPVSLRKNRLGTIGQYPHFNQSIWEVAGAGTKEGQKAFLMNELGNICEGVASNLFFIQNSKLSSPSLQTGCYADPLRDIVIAAAELLGIPFQESDQISMEVLPEMDEIFLASEAGGIEPVLGFYQRRYLSHQTVKLHSRINDLLKEKRPFS